VKITVDYRIIIPANVVKCPDALRHLLPRGIYTKSTKKEYALITGFIATYFTSRRAITRGSKGP